MKMPVSLGAPQLDPFHLLRPPSPRPTHQPLMLLPTMLELVQLVPSLVAVQLLPSQWASPPSQTSLAAKPASGPVKAQLVGKGRSVSALPSQCRRRRLPLKSTISLNHTSPAAAPQMLGP
jgi:hypothetical protein